MAMASASAAKNWRRKKITEVSNKFGFDQRFSFFPVLYYKPSLAQKAAALSRME
jgi:hypothetical protein